MTQPTPATVCVVVPVWGAERTLDRCVQSILTQRLTGTLAPPLDRVALKYALLPLVQVFCPP